MPKSHVRTYFRPSHNVSIMVELGYVLRSLDKSSTFDGNFLYKSRQTRNAGKFRLEVT